MARVAVKQLGISKNYLINGNFDFWQRTGAGQTTVTTTRAYGADRWLLFPSTTNLNASQIIRAVSTNVGSTFDLNFGPWSFNEKCSIAQIVENNNTVPLRGKDVTFSFNIKSSALASLIRFELLAWTGGADAVTTFSNATPYTNWTTYSLAANFTSIAVGTGTSVGGTYTKFSLSGNVPTNTNNLICVITYNQNANQQQFVSQAMLNEGLGAQSFSIAGSSIGDELALCQRYFEKTYTLDTSVGSPGVDEGIYNFQMNNGATVQSILPIKFTVSKRIVPIVTFYSRSGSSGVWRNYNNNTDVAVSGQVGGQHSWGVNTTAFPAGVNLGGHWTASAEL